jgi:hypothetical protein
MHDGVPNLKPDEKRGFSSIETSPNRDSVPTDECRQRFRQSIGFNDL